MPPACDGAYHILGQPLKWLEYAAGACSFTGEGGESLRNAGAERSTFDRQRWTHLRAQVLGVGRWHVDNRS